MLPTRFEPVGRSPDRLTRFKSGRRHTPTFCCVGCPRSLRSLREPLLAKTWERLPAGSRRLPAMNPRLAPLGSVYDSPEGPDATSVSSGSDSVVGRQSRLAEFAVTLGIDGEFGHGRRVAVLVDGDEDEP